MTFRDLLGSAIRPSSGAGRGALGEFTERFFPGWLADMVGNIFAFGVKGL